MLISLAKSKKYILSFKRIKTKRFEQVRLRSEKLELIKKKKAEAKSILLICKIFSPKMMIMNERLINVGKGYLIGRDKN